MSEPESFCDRTNKMAEQFNVVDQHTAALIQTVNQSDSPQSGLILQYLENLSNVLEELKRAEEELCQQNHELQKAQQDIRIEQQRYEDLFNFAPDGYLVTDIHGKIQEANQAASDLFKVAPKYLVNKILTFFTPENYRRVFRLLLLQLQSIDRIQEWEMPLIAGGDSQFEAAITVAAVKDGDGKTIGLRWLIRDITARKQIEEQLRQIQLQNLELIEADRLKEQFIATMSHELRTPLTAILGFSTLLMRQFHQRFDEQQVHLMERIIENGRHLLNLIEDILDVIRLRANQVELRLETFDAVNLVICVIEELRPFAEKKNLDLNLQIFQPSIMVINDRDRLRQILVNLISNAIKFTDVGNVTVQVRSPKREQLSITVQDTGIGIAESDLKLIFQEFRQVNQTITRLQGGTGLGLAITQALTRLMGGEISVQSQIGRGSSFLLELPCQVSFP
jgi:PAS domain S-box-containing protein